MKRTISIATAALLAAAMTVPAWAEAGKIKDIPIGSSNQVEMIGTIEPTIMSVTMPTFIPFQMSNSVTGQNKVVSPRIPVKNNSTVPVKVDVVYTEVNINQFRNTTWSDTGAVGDNQIAIGFKQEVKESEMPSDLAQTRWLAENRSQNTNILILNANETQAMYVVGTMGAKVDETATFSVIPTLVVSRTSNVN